jgi:hypothetical protein
MWDKTQRYTKELLQKKFTIADLVLDLGLMSDAVQELPHLAWTIKSATCICTGD